MTEVVVEPTIKVVEKEVDKVNISIIGLTLGVSCVVRAECRKGDDYPCLIQTYLLENDEYAAWGNSDEYIIDLVMTRLGLTPIPPAPPIVVEEPVNLIVEELPN